MPTTETPKYYPLADRTSQWKGNGGTTMPRIDKVLLHSTETAGWPGYPKFEPTFTYDPWRDRWRQHLPITGSASTLKSAGIYRTNRMNVVQVEIVGYIDPILGRRTGKDLRQMPTEGVEGLAAFLAWMHAQFSVPMSRAARWPDYPDSYGNDEGQRMSVAQFRAFAGICGHEHAPGNVHGDPGHIPIDAIVARAAALTRPVPELPTVSISKLIIAAKADPGRPQGGVTPGAEESVRLVEVALKVEKLLSARYAMDGSYGTSTIKAYAKWQRKLGWTGKDADGIPGVSSLKKLAARHQFRVVD